MSRFQAMFSILAVLVVCSLISTTLGSAVYEDLRGQSSDNTQGVDTGNSTDPVLAKMQADAAASPNDADTLAALANYLSNTGQTDESIPWYEKAIALKPDDYDLRLDFALSLSRGEKYKDAEVQFKKVIAVVPNYAQAYFSLGQLYENWVPPRTSDAIAQLNAAIALDPSSVIAERAREELSRLGAATPSASPMATP